MDATLLHEQAAREPEHWWFRARRELLVRLVRRFVPEGGRLLDVGCGTGFVLERLRDYYEVWGLEPAAAAARRCRARGIEHVIEGPVSAVDDLPAGRFDCVAFLDVLEHLDDPAAALRSAARVLAPGGAAVVTVPAYQWLWSEHDRAHQHRRRYDRGSLEALLADAGFAPVVLSYYNARLFPLAVAQRSLWRLAGARSPLVLRTPPAPLNALLERVLLSEWRVLARATRRGGYRVGLSLVAVARVAGPAS